MTDITKFIFPVFDDLKNNNFDEWTHIVLEIESDLSYVGSTIKFFNNDKCIDSNSKSLTPTSNFQIIQMHKMMEKEKACFEKWNRAKVIFHRDGRYELSFSWDQTLQDTWENAKKN